MLTPYIEAALKKARWEILPDDCSFYVEIPDIPGVYANSTHLENCLQELREVLEEWIILSIARCLPLPVIDGMELNTNIKETA